MSGTKKEYTAQEKALMFSSATRQNLQMLPKVVVNAGASRMQFAFPKSRLLSNIYLRIKAQVKVAHATKTTIPVDEHAPYRLLRLCTLDLNNGFSPYRLSGEELAILSCVDRNGKKIYEKSNYRNAEVGGTMTASADGTVNEFDYVLEMPITLNKMSPTGIVLLQNDQTNVTLNVDIANGIDMIVGDKEGYTIDIVKVEGEVCLETFSIPANENAIPDLSVLKLVQARTESMASVGQQVVKLSTGTIYRKLILHITDENGNPIADEDLTDISLVFNQADRNYVISPQMLRAINTGELGFELPKGVYVFDFSSGGNFANYGNTRDYIDTEKLTEFWVTFSTGKRGKVTIISECISRLRG